jgi:hypothetical protein
MGGNFEEYLVYATTGKSPFILSFILHIPFDIAKAKKYKCCCLTSLKPLLKRNLGQSLKKTLSSRPRQQYYFRKPNLNKLFF